MGKHSLLSTFGPRPAIAAGENIEPPFAVALIPHYADRRSNKQPKSHCGQWTQEGASGLTGKEPSHVEGRLMGAGREAHIRNEPQSRHG
jgi:hypothetical protein